MFYIGKILTSVHQREVATATNRHRLRVTAVKPDTQTECKVGPIAAGKQRNGLDDIFGRCTYWLYIYVF